MSTGAGGDLRRLADELIPALATRSAELGRLARELAAQRDAGLFTRTVRNTSGGDDPGGDDVPERPDSALLPDIEALTRPVSPAAILQDIPIVQLSSPLNPADTVGAPPVPPVAGPVASESPKNAQPAPRPHAPSAPGFHCYTCGTTKTVKWRKAYTPEGVFW